MQAKHISDETAADDNGISASAQVRPTMPL